MFLIILAVVLAGAAAHVALRGGPRTRERVGVLVLLWTLVGYCGIPMLVVAGMLLVHPHETAEAFGFPPDNPIAVFFGWAYLGMALSAVLSPRYRGPYLVAPTVTWAVFFLGATFIHLGEGHGGGTHAGALAIVATHGLISLILVAALVASGAWREHAHYRSRV
ncbi:MAG: DUF6790 family protein [Gemmatimonadota bacterium]